MPGRTALVTLLACVAGLVLAAPALALDIADATPASGTVGVPYSFTFSLSPGSGSPGASWSISSGVASTRPHALVERPDRDRLGHADPGRVVQLLPQGARQARAVGVLHRGGVHHHHRPGARDHRDPGPPGGERGRRVRLPARDVGGHRPDLDARVRRAAHGDDAQPGGSSGRHADAGGTRAVHRQSRRRQPHRRRSSSR